MPDREPAPGIAIVNAATARFECVYGRSCDGLCCRNGRPPVAPDERRRIDAHLDRILPALRPEARALVEKRGYLSRRGLADHPMIRVVAGWCVFFNQGCVLHKIGAAEGDKYRYKPAPCSLFPLAKDHKDRWQIRQRGYNREAWDLFCLDPQATTTPAVQSLREEIALAEALERKEAEGADPASPLSPHPEVKPKASSRRMLQMWPEPPGASVETRTSSGPQDEG